MEKVCLINNLYPPNSVGGAETVVFKLAQKHKNKSRKVFVITLDCENNKKITKNEESGVLIYRIPKFNIFPYKELNKKNFLLKLVWHFFDKFGWWGRKEINKILVEENPNIVHTHNLTGMGFFIPKLIKKLKIEHVHTLHDVQLVEPSGILKWNHKKDSLAQKFYSLIVKKKFGSPDYILYPSEFIKYFYKSRNFFYKSLWRKTNNEFTPLNIFKNKENNNKFVFVGSLNRNKGVHILLKAWKAMPKNIGMELHIVGDGPMMKDVLKAKEKDSSIFVYGRLNKKELDEVYRKCSVLIFCSVCLENKPNVILEALENNLFVVASNTGGVKELLNKKTGKLYRPGNKVYLINILYSLRMY